MPHKTEVSAGSIVLSKDEQETITLGQELAALLRPGDVVALFGELGSGKTTFVRGVCLGLECQDDPSSPTFTLINEYAGKFAIYHFDFYRIRTSDEARELGCHELFSGSGVCLVEWPERVVDLLPATRFEVHFSHLFPAGKENEREVRILKP